MQIALKAQSRQARCLGINKNVVDNPKFGGLSTTLPSMPDLRAPKPRSKHSWLYALISFACPFAAYAIIDIYQQYAYADFWQSLVPGEDASNTAGAMMAFAGVIEAMVAVLIRCIVGILFAGLGLWNNRRIISLGMAALLFNAIPLVLLLLLFVKAMTRGL